MVNTTPNKISNPYEGISSEKLNADLVIAQETKNRDSAVKIMEELKAREKPKDENGVDALGVKSEELKKKLNDINVSAKDKKALINEFLEKDIGQYRSGIKTELEKTNEAKDKKIADLQAQLEGTITSLPKLGDYLSRERRRLVNIHEKFKSFEGKEDYPKNFLIYAMGVTNSSLFWTREKVKRGLAKLTRSFKNDDIGKNLQILEKKLAEPGADKESPRKKALKNLIKDELQKAKTEYINKQKASLGLAA